MTQPTPTIVGAGLAGLIAAHAWPQSAILESSTEPRQQHKALLRFRSNAVSRLTGIDFRKVLVRKGIWADMQFQSPSIRWANLYAQKVLKRLVGDRSIWNLDTVERFIAPDDFYDQLINAVEDRIHWGCDADFSRPSRNPLLSTAPLPVVLQQLGIDAGIEFPRAPINVTRWRVPGADVFQTVYFPEHTVGVYRASITGDILIAESVDLIDADDEKEISRAFAIAIGNCERLDSVEQKYGKIAPIDDALRKQLLFRLTHEHQVYSLGRFATWRNILLDDVVDDIAVIKKLLRSNNAYDVRRATT